MSVSPESFLDLLYNQKLPKVYVEEDSKIEVTVDDTKLKAPLKRYLQSLILGGYYVMIRDIEGIMSLIDPNKIPEEFLPYLCECFGLTYFPDIDATYQRKFLANIGEIIKRRGTYSCVHYLTKVLTGLESELKCENGVLDIKLLAQNLEQINNIGVSAEVISNYIGSQIPYYITTTISSKIDVQVIRSKSYSHSAVGYYKFYNINVYKEEN